MKRYKTALIAGGVLAVVGISVLFGALYSRGADSFTLPKGEDWFYFIEYNLESGGYISVQYSETQSRPVDAYIFDSSGYQEYSYQGHASSITERIGRSSGTISTTVPSAGSYYVVFDHGLGFENSEQKVTLLTREVGLSYMPIIIGLPLLVAGIALIIVGLRLKKSEEPRVITKPPPDDVLIFERRR